MSVFYQPIASTTVGAGGAATITFSNINQGYQDLYVMISARNSVNDRNIYGTMNSDGINTNNTGYNDIGFFGSGSVNTGYKIINDTIFRAPGATASSDTANTFGVSTLYIANYASGSPKSAWMVGAANNNSTAQFGNSVGYQGQAWNKTAPITSLTFSSAGNFVQHTNITLFGVSNVYDTAAPLAPTIGTVTDLAGIAAVAFTANDSAVGQTADSYSVQDVTIMGAPVSGQVSPIPVPVTTGVAYNGLAVTARNSIGTNVSANPAGFTSLNNFATIASYVFPNSSTNAILFTNVPQYYKHLQVRIIGRSTRTFSGNAIDVVNMQLNGDFQTTQHNMYGNAFSITSNYNAGLGTGAMVSASSGSNTTNSSLFSLYVCDILDYTNTSKFKTTRTNWGWDTNLTTGGDVNFSGMTSACWNTFSSISTVYLNCSNGNFVQNSTVVLYGIG